MKEELSEKGTVEIDGHKITVKYELPEYCWCYAPVQVIVDSTLYDIGHPLVSGGSVWFDDEWNDHVSTGDWMLKDDVKLPDELKPIVLEAINEIIPLGCCGGCI